MKKKLLCGVLLSFSFFLLNAQKGNFKAVPVKPLTLKSQQSLQKTNAACDTLNLAEANNWSAYYYTYGTSGYVFGVSDLSAFGINIKHDANFFDQSGTDNNFIAGGLAYFAFANSNVEANLDKDIFFRVYDDNAGEPGNLLGSTSLKLSDVHNDVEAGYLTEFKFSSPIPMPASKKFYVSIDHSNFVWTETVHDSIAIVANGNDEATAGAYQLLDVTGVGEVWVPVNEFWTSSGDPLDVNLFLFPYVSNAEDGCNTVQTATRTCFTDGFGYEWHIAYLYDGGKPRQYHATGKVYIESGQPWTVTAWGTFTHVAGGNLNNGVVELHAVNPNPDGCSQYVDSFIYVGNAVVERDGSVTYTGSGTWTSYCSGSVFNAGTWDASGPCGAGLKIDPKGPAKANMNLRIAVSPNPVKNSTNISYNLQKESYVNITIYNYMQQPVKVLANGLQSAGQHTYTWDTRSASGSLLPNGLYRVVGVVNGKSYSGAIQIMR
jgi:hypothetical protein